ncbi:Protein SGT1 [Tolypocladium ophioglossoides CBS 100239]|uniref:Protein SGT1 n=1 Tax=Tolypocladium ophioglossoides (strain CBS 100239) TaxID=1163406 RepID=A0A0L0NGW8_TOLOC|nr:Protein SGT1 [Tolypocladium ophioglossoides CBS 100239]
MSHITIAQEGLKALEAKRWTEAVDKLSTALRTSTNPAWLIARSKALIQVGLFDPALDDACLAWQKAHERNQRLLMMESHYRRAVAYYRMGKLADADCCCVYTMRLIKGLPAVEQEDPKVKWTDKDGFWMATLEVAMEEAKSDAFNKGGAPGTGPTGSRELPAPPAQVSEWRLASTLRMQILGAMATLPKDDRARKVTASQFPERTLLARLGVEPNKPPAPHVPVREDTPLRLQEFQNNIATYLSIFSKGVDEKKLKVQFLPLAVHLDAITYPNGEEKEFHLELWDEINPAASRYVVTPNKVELTLAKKTPGKWAQLKKATDNRKAEVPQPTEAKKPSGDQTATASSFPPANKDSSSSSGPNSPEPPKPASSGPTYPSSARSGPKNWDLIADDDADDEEEGGVNAFFQKLYKNATPEQQRAMMKSFIESNGTSLSTDWEDIKGRTVETVPPEGVEEKKWE